MTAEGTGPVEAVATLTRWVDDGPVSPAEARRAVLDVIAHWDNDVASIAEQVRGGESPLDEVGATIAAMRGEAGMPRVVRMPQAERTRAVAYLIAAAIGLRDELGAREADHVLLERMLGMRSWHAGGLAEATNIGVDVDDLMLLRSGEDAVRAVAACSDEELEHARLLAQLVADWSMPLTVMMLAEFGAKAGAFVELVRTSLGDGLGALGIVLAVRLVVAVALNRPEPDEMRKFREQIASGAIDLELLQQFPRGDRQELFRQLSARRQEVVMEGLRRRLPSHLDP
jgi:hypothetical protein